MKVLTGIDIVYLPRFKKALLRGGVSFSRRIFHEDELDDDRIEHLAGIFAAKEAIMKALSLPIDSWNSICITNSSSGAPKITMTNNELPITNYSLSISHDGKYVVAQFVAIVKS